MKIILEKKDLEVIDQFLKIISDTREVNRYRFQNNGFCCIVYFDDDHMKLKCETINNYYLFDKSNRIIFESSKDGKIDFNKMLDIDKFNENGNIDIVKFTEEFITNYLINKLKENKEEIIYHKDILHKINSLAYPFDD